MSDVDLEAYVVYLKIHLTVTLIRAILMLSVV